MIYDSDTIYIYSNFTILRCTKLYWDTQKGAWYTDESSPIKADSINDLVLFREFIGREVMHPEYNIQGKILFNCTTDSYKQKDWFSPEKKLRQFVFVKWYTEGMDIIPSWININKLIFK